MLGLIEGLSTRSQIPDNNNQQLLGLIEEFTKEPSETKRPRTIAPSEPPATSHRQPATSPLQF